MTNQEKWADKINALLRKAESVGPEEAELFFGKAQELMAKYMVDEAMLASARGFNQADDKVTSQEFVCVGIYRFPLGQLTYYVMLNNGLKGILLSDPGWRTVGGKTYKETYVLVGVGFKSDMERAEMLATSLQLQAMRAESAWWKENSHLYSNLPKGKQHHARRGFLFAFAEGANTKMSEATIRGKAAAAAEHGKDSVALVLRDKSLMVQDKFEQLFPETRQRKDRKNHGDIYARQHGRAAGLRADVGQGGLRGTKQIGR